MLKVRFIALNDQVDSYLRPQSVNNVIVPFKNLLNDEYCRDFSIKIRSSLNIKRENGLFIGSFPCYGYIKDLEDKHKLIIDDEAAENVRTAFRMFLNGSTLRGMIMVFWHQVNIKEVRDLMIDIIALTINLFGIQ